MGIYGMMHTSVSGMNAQTNRLSAISDNIANSSTIGYKRSEARFATLVVSENVTNYQSGSVQSSVRRSISVEGTHRATGRDGDLSILGNGFFIVSNKKDGSGTVSLTRAGDFQPDKDGFLRNSAGFYLLDELGQVVNVGSSSAKALSPAEATKLIDFKGGLNFDAKPTGDIEDPQTHQKHPVDVDPSNPKTYNHKTSVTTYGPKGEKIIVDVFLQKRSDGTWRACAGTKGADGKYSFDTEGGKQYIDLVFNKDGSLDLSKTQPANGELPIKIDGRVVKVDFKNLSEAGTAYTVSPVADGHEAGSYESYTISREGEVVIKLTNGLTLSKGFINLATVPAVDLLSVKTGTVFQTNPESGNLIMGRPGSSSFGYIQNQQLEESNADIASELTEMIEAQRNFSANSKVFQTGSEVMDVVVNLKR